MQAGIEALRDAQQAIGDGRIAVVLTAAAGIEEDQSASLVAFEERRRGEGVIVERQEFLSPDTRPLDLPLVADHPTAPIGEELCPGAILLRFVPFGGSFNVVVIVFPILFM